MILSFIFLKHSYRCNNLTGVLFCLTGCGLIILADSFVKIENGIIYKCFNIIHFVNDLIILCMCMCVLRTT